MAEIEMVPVKSTAIKAVGYDDVERLMDVQFVRSDKTWRLFNVPPNVHRTLMESQSKGSHFTKNIKPYFKSQLLS